MFVDFLKIFFRRRRRRLHVDASFFRQRRKGFDFDDESMFFRRRRTLLTINISWDVRAALKTYLDRRAAPYGKTIALLSQRLPTVLCCLSPTRNLNDTIIYGRLKRTCVSPATIRSPYCAPLPTRPQFAGTSPASSASAARLFSIIHACCTIESGRCATCAVRLSPPPSRTLIHLTASHKLRQQIAYLPHRRRR